MGALETGKTLAEQILAKLPESLRGQVSTALLAPEATDALTLLGDSALARSDYSRQMDAIKAKETELATLQQTLDTDFQRLDGWWKTNEPKLKEYDTIKPEYERLKAGGTNTTTTQTNTTTQTPPGLTKEDIDKLLKERDEGYARVLSVTTTLAAKHLKDFNEVLDVNELVDVATKRGLPLYHPKADTDAYREVHKEKLAAKAKAEEDARVNKLVDERFAERAKTQQHPFPVRGPEPSPLDVLEQPDRAKEYTADRAAAHYEELVAQSLGR